MPGIAAQIIEIEAARQTALVEINGCQSRVGLVLVEEAVPGDYVLVHAGQALAVLDREEAEARIKLWEECLNRADIGAVPRPGIK